MKYSHVTATTINQGIEQPLHEESPHAPLPSVPSPNSWLLATTDLLSVALVLPLKFHMNGLIHYVTTLVFLWAILFHSHSM